ncbi:MAG: hypothetical protein ACWGHO_05600 [Candidatus Moraniibacteriota bacterium]|jgi:hypothetical protein
MIKSIFYIIFSIIFISASALIIIWIIQQESRRDKTKQVSHIILNEENNDEKYIPSQTDVTDYYKKDMDSTLLEIDSLIDAVEKTEVPE